MVSDNIDNHLDAVLISLGAESLERAFMMFEALDYAARTGVAAAMLKKEAKELTAEELAVKNSPKVYEATLGADNETAIREEMSAMCARCCRNKIFTMGVGAFAKKVAQAIKAAIPCQRVGVAVLGMEVPHTHIHLVPLATEADMDFRKKKLELSQEEFAEIAASIYNEYVKIQ